nr:uncharacterized protein LOC107126717 [Macaca fascicularis]
MQPACVLYSMQNSFCFSRALCYSAENSIMKEKYFKRQHFTQPRRLAISSQIVAATSSWGRNESSVCGDPVSPESITTADLPLYISKRSAVPATSSCHLQTLEGYNQTSVL